MNKERPDYVEVTLKLSPDVIHYLDSFEIDCPDFSCDRNSIVAEAIENFYNRQFLVQFCCELNLPFSLVRAIVPPFGSITDLEAVHYMRLFEKLSDNWPSFLGYAEEVSSDA